MKMKIGLIIFLSVIICCCNTRHESSYKNSSVDTVTKEIPLTKKGKPDFFYKLIKQKAAQLKLDSLEKGYDSLQIRIWYDYSFLENQQLVVIKRVSQKWNCELYTLKVDWNDSSRYDKIISKIVIEKEPISGWDNFTKQLLDLKIMSLPDMRKVPGYNEIIGADGNSFNVEIATKDKYRFYGYWEPGNFSQYWQAKNMEDILRLIEREFDFKRLRK